LLQHGATTQPAQHPPHPSQPRQCIPTSQPFRALRMHTFCRHHGSCYSFTQLYCPFVCAADGDGEFVLDALTWPAPCTIAASGLWYDVDNEDEPESMDAYLLAVTWEAWAGEAAAAPSGLEARLTSYVTLQVCGCATEACCRGLMSVVWQLLSIPCSCAVSALVRAENSFVLSKCLGNINSCKLGSGCLVDEAPCVSLCP
jgi:hypothetical protein